MAGTHRPTAPRSSPQLLEANTHMLGFGQRRASGRLPAGTASIMERAEQQELVDF